MSTECIQPEIHVDMSKLRTPKVGGGREGGMRSGIGEAGTYGAARTSERQTRWQCVLAITVGLPMG